MKLHPKDEVGGESDVVLQEVVVPGRPSSPQIDYDLAGEPSSQVVDYLSTAPGSIVPAYHNDSMEYLHAIDGQMSTLPDDDIFEYYHLILLSLPLDPLSLHQIYLLSSLLIFQLLDPPPGQVLFDTILKYLAAIVRLPFGTLRSEIFFFCIFGDEIASFQQLKAFLVLEPSKVTQYDLGLVFVIKHFFNQ